MNGQVCIKNAEMMHCKCCFCMDFQLGVEETAETTAVSKENDILGQMSKDATKIPFFHHDHSGNFQRDSSYNSGRGRYDELFGFAAKGRHQYL